LAAPVLCLRPKKINIIPHSNRIRIYVDDEENRYFRLRTIKRELGNIVVKGIPTVSRAVISKKADDPKQNSLFVEGYGLREVMNCEGVIGTKTTTNHVRAVPASSHWRPSKT
jgi:DNA-directed RNA polymerase III subunit RPC1